MTRPDPLGFMTAVPRRLSSTSHEIRQTDAVHVAHQNTLHHAFHNNPERFVNKAPTPPDKPTAAWINPPAPMPKIQA